LAQFARRGLEHPLAILRLGDSSRGTVRRSHHDLGSLAWRIGSCVDEATVTIENIHTRLD